MSGKAKTTDRMRIMMIGPYPTSPHRIDGGVAAALMYLSEALAQEPSVDLVGVRIATRQSPMAASAEFAWPVVALPLGRMSLSTLYIRQKHHLAQLLSKFRPDLVHAQGTDVAGYVAAGCGVPTVVTVHGLLAECARYQTDSASKLRATLAASLTERFTVRRARHLIAISPYVARYYGGDVKGRIHEIANAVSPQFFRVTRNPEQGRLLYAGRIANGKGLLELLQAVARNRSSVPRLVLAGAASDPEYQKRVAIEVERVGLTGRVEFAGLLDEPALLREFARADALVLPSYQETAPMVVQQAMAAGLAVIATKVGGIPDQLEHARTGWLFEAGNVEQLTDLIAKLCADEQAKRQVAAAAKLVAAERYDSSSVARATIAVYRSMLAESDQFAA